MALTCSETVSSKIAVSRMINEILPRKPLFFCCPTWVFKAGLAGISPCLGWALPFAVSFILCGSFGLPIQRHFALACSGIQTIFQGLLQSPLVFLSGDLITFLSVLIRCSHYC